jgi:hypothetical protein
VGGRPDLKYNLVEIIKEVALNQRNSGTLSQFITLFEIVLYRIIPSGMEKF